MENNLLRYSPQNYTKTITHNLSVARHLLMIKLGCTAKERICPQEVQISFKIHFKYPPEAVLSDRLQDTFCYSELIGKIEKFCEGKEYNLVEKLAQDIFNLIEEFTGNEFLINLEVHKVNPPIKNLLGGVKYEIFSS